MVIAITISKSVFVLTPLYGSAEIISVLINSNKKYVSNNVPLDWSLVILSTCICFVGKIF